MSTHGNGGSRSKESIRSRWFDVNIVEVVASAGGKPSRAVPARQPGALPAACRWRTHRRHRILLFVRLDEKARENLEAAERLLPDDAGRDGLLNAAASRAYYAAYLAVADRALGAGLAFTDRDSTYFRHDDLPDDACRWGIIDDDGRDELSHLYALRIKADYLEDQVDLEEATLAHAVAERFVARLVEEAR